jgi:hypothetical protein
MQSNLRGARERQKLVQLDFCASESSPVNLLFRSICVVRGVPALTVKPLAAVCGRLSTKVSTETNCLRREPKEHRYQQWDQIPHKRGAC